MARQGPALTLGRQAAPRACVLQGVVMTFSPLIMYRSVTDSFGGMMLDRAASRQKTTG